MSLKTTHKKSNELRTVILICSQLKAFCNKKLSPNIQASKQLNYSPHYTTFRHGYYQTDADYLDFKIQVNRDDHPKYAKYFSETIIVKPELGVFIDRGFINSQEYGLKISHRKTNFAIGISIVIGLVSIWTSIVISKGNTQFWKENEIIENSNHIEIVEILNDIKELSNRQNIIIDSLDENIENLSDDEFGEIINELIKLNNNIIDIIDK